MSDLVQRLREVFKEGSPPWEAADLIEQQAQQIKELSKRCNNISDDAENELKSTYAERNALRAENERLQRWLTSLVGYEEAHCATTDPALKDAP